MRWSRMLLAGVGMVLPLAALAIGQTRPGDPVAAVISQVHAGMTSGDVHRIVRKFLPDRRDEYTRLESAYETGVLEIFALDEDTSLVLRFGRNTSINIPRPCLKNQKVA